MSSALEHTVIVDDYLALEKAQGRIGVLQSGSPAAKACHVSPFGVITKKSKPGKWRLIIDLSTPNGHSVNYGIEKEICSLSYVTIDEEWSACCILSQNWQRWMSNRPLEIFQFTQMTGFSWACYGKNSCLSTKSYLLASVQRR